jgi:peptidoglycan hydrolase CwlO-like protein
MKKAFILSLAFALSFSLMQSKTIQADEFSGKEDEYISLCSSATLTKSKEKVCKRFNKYLKDKTSNLKSSINNSKADIDKTSNNIEETNKKVEELTDRITELLKQIEYYKVTIQNYQNEIDTKVKQIGSRMYSMQSTYNTNAFISYLLESKSISDLYSRLASLDSLLLTKNS